MTIQVTILGLGQIGSSIGLALAKHKEEILRVGHDKDRYAVTFAKNNDVVDKHSITLTGAVEHADIVFLALPFQEIHPILEHICQDLKQGALVIDTGPLKEPVLKWIDELLPEGCDYVGFTPVIGSDYLNEFEFGPDTAAADLFKGSLMGIVGGKKTSEKAVNMAANLAQLLGASPYFSDSAEIDGLMTVSYFLPRLMAASLLKVSLDTPGWKEVRKLTGRAFSQVSSPLGQDEITGALAAGMINNPENTKRVLNDLIRVLIDFRDLDESVGQDQLEESLTKLQQGRDLWLDDRKKGSWIDMPKTEYRRRGMLSQLLGFKNRKKAGGDK
jgi:prephenate dehydrogenase